MNEAICQCLYWGSYEKCRDPDLGLTCGRSRSRFWTFKITMKVGSHIYAHVSNKHPKKLDLISALEFLVPAF